MSWDKDSLWAKAKIYVDRALNESRDSEMFPFWISLSLELLARSAISSVSPILLAESSKDDATNILYALKRPTGKGKPKSIAISSVFKLCRSLVPKFTDEELKICNALAEMRNQELHTGGLAFNNLPAASWLTHFYRAASALSEIQSRTLEDFLGTEEFQAALQMMSADTAAVKAKVQKALNVHKVAFNAKKKSERLKLSAESSREAETMAHNHGHRVICPACGSKSFVSGESFSLKSPKLEGGLVVVRETMLPRALNCTACGLSLTTHAELVEAGLGSQYTRTSRFSPLSYYVEEYDGPEYDNE